MVDNERSASLDSAFQLVVIRVADPDERPASLFLVDVVAAEVGPKLLSSPMEWREVVCPLPCDDAEVGRSSIVLISTLSTVFGVFASSFQPEAVKLMTIAFKVYIFGSSDARRTV